MKEQLKQMELPGINRFGREFRQGRFENAITRHALLSTGDIDPREEGLTFNEAQRIMGYAIVSLYRACLKEGDQQERMDAIYSMHLLETFLHPERNTQGILYIQSGYAEKQDERQVG